MRSVRTHLGWLPLVVLLSAAGAQVASAEDPAQLVNPFIGTANGGNTYPGATLPFGMVAFSPEEVPVKGAHARRGGTLDFVLAHRPDVRWGRAAPPPSFSPRSVQP